jgi:hypothetical protein
LAAACSQTYVQVQIPYRENKTVDFTRYQDVYFIDFVACAPDLVLDFDAENKKAFLEELPFVINKKITRLDPPYWDMTRALLCKHCPDVEIQYADNVFFRNVFRSHPRALFFTGKLNLAVSKMGVVKEVKDEDGNRKNVYASVQTWDLVMKVWVIDGDSGQVLLQETFNERSEPGTDTSPEFNYSVMLNRITAKLGAKLQPRKVLQERYFLQG